MAESDPTPPRGAAIAGRGVEIIGWVLVAVAVGLIVLQVVEASASIPGVVLALLVAVAGGATVATGRTIERSREQ